jgi:ATP-dependent DNA helicase RecQ
MDKATVLKQYFGHTTFRPGQEKLIDSLLAGRDVLGVMPTGAGKSICYQIPALLLPDITLVISPLISLMKDQVSALLQSGIPAACINSSLSAEQYNQVFQQAENKKYKIIYIAPERLMTRDFLNLISRVPVSLVAVDEAHCVSQWGQDFRSSYLKISNFVNQLPIRPIVGAFTATATTEVKDDIVRLLQLRNPLLMTTGFDRPNLYFEVAKPKNKLTYLYNFLEWHRKQCGIVYCATRKTVESLCSELNRHDVSATCYHAGLKDEARRVNQDDFIYDRKHVMVATNAFGMGIDKSNVGFVVHYNMPKNLESYYQEAGRAGRDGEHADCVLLFSRGDVQTAKFLIQNSNENEDLSESEHEQVLHRDLNRLNKMVGYCKTTRCLRSYILKYFGEQQIEPCGNCGNCKSQYIQRDITTEAQKILSAVARVERKYPYGLGESLIVQMLHGSDIKRISQLGLNKFSTYGIMRDVDQRKIHDYIDFLISKGYLELTQTKYPVLRLTDHSKEILFQGIQVTLKEKAAKRWKDSHSTEEKASLSLTRFESDESSLYEALRALRTKISRAENVPAYVVFSNATLSDMAMKCPHNMVDFLEVSGVGETKAKRYGMQFLNTIKSWEDGGSQNG